MRAYQISKRCNSLRVMAEAVRWGQRGARVNAISLGIVSSPPWPTTSSPGRAARATAE